MDGEAKNTVRISMRKKKITKSKS